MCAMNSAGSEVKLSREVLTDGEVDELVRAALRKRKGRATESDIIVESGIPTHLLGPSLRRTMLTYECAIESNEEGDVVYVFDADLARRKGEPGERWREFRRRAWAAFRTFYKVAIAVVLIAYFTIFVALVIAATVALLSQSQSRSRGGSFSSSSSSSSGLGDFFLWVWLFGDSDYRSSRRGWRRRSGYSAGPTHSRSSRWAHGAPSQGQRKDRRAFYAKVFSFVFGREEGERDKLFTERELLAYIRSVGGVVSPTELATRTGWSLHAAEKQSTRLIAAYGGDVEVSEDGQVLYVFPELMSSAGGPISVDTRPAPPIWERVELEEPLTGNTGAANFGIAMLNLSVLFGAFVAIPHYAAPVLGIDMNAPAVNIGLYVIPAVYSALFFLIPVYRLLFQVYPENRRRARRNTQRALLKQIYLYSLPEPTPVTASVDALALPEGVSISANSDRELGEALKEIAFDYGADATVRDDRSVSFRFERIAVESRAAKTVRALGTTLPVTHIGERVPAELTTGTS